MLIRGAEPIVTFGEESVQQDNSGSFIQQTHDCGLPTQSGQHTFLDRAGRCRAAQWPIAPSLDLEFTGLEEI